MTQQSTKPLAVIFDMNGVIIDDMSFHAEAWVDFFAKKGKQIDAEEFEHKHNGRIGEEIIADLIDEQLSEQQVADYIHEKEVVYRDLFRPHLKAVHGLPNFLQELSGHNVPMAVTTAAPPDNVDFILDGTGLRNYFKVIVDASDVSAGKPDPEGYTKTIAELAFPPEQCIVFEDSYHGVAAAKAAGAKVVGMTTTMGADKLSQADMIIEDFTQITYDDLLPLV